MNQDDGCATPCFMIVRHHPTRANGLANFRCCLCHTISLSPHLKLQTRNANQYRPENVFLSVSVFPMTPPLLKTVYVLRRGQTSMMSGIPEHISRGEQNYSEPCAPFFPPVRTCITEWSAVR